MTEKQSVLGNLERELESLRNYHKFSKEEKNRLDEEIERLSIEKRRLISKDLYFSGCLILSRFDEKRERIFEEGE